MGELVGGGAVLRCSLGMARTVLNLPPGRPATVDEKEPRVHIQGFGACTSFANPSVAAATAAAMGVMTPQPCVPVIPNAWTPSSPVVLVGPQTAIDMTSTCRCQWGGVISIEAAGHVTIPPVQPQS